jgi:hypothetical protein
MPEQLFDIDAKDLVRLKKFYKKAPKQFARASASTLTSFAAGTRRKSLLIVNNRMTVRNKNFVSGALRFNRAKGNVPMAAQVATAGSIKRNRFTGWEEQELGTQTERTRTATLFARGGGSKQIPRSLRMDRTSTFDTPDNYEGKTYEQRTFLMLKAKAKKAFVITKHRKFRKGLYKFRGKKIKMVQAFDNRKQPKRIKWLTMARKLYFSTTSIDSVWANSLRRVLKFK